MKMIFFLLITGILAGKRGLTFDLLKNVRSNITFLPYTPDQRVQVSRGAQSLLGVICLSDHRYMSIDFKKWITIN
jgi:hypothetical protein